MKLFLSMYPGKSQRQLKENEIADAIQRKLETIPHNGAASFVGIPNPYYKKGGNTPYYAAVRLVDCMSSDAQIEMLSAVNAMKTVCVST